MALPEENFILNHYLRLLKEGAEKATKEIEGLRKIKGVTPGARLTIEMSTLETFAKTISTLAHAGLAHAGVAKRLPPKKGDPLSSTCNKTRKPV